MTAGERFQDWINKAANRSKDTVAEWILGWFQAVGQNFVRFIFPSLSDYTKNQLRELRDLPGTPPQLKELYDNALEGGDVISNIWGWLFTMLGSLLALVGLGGPQGRIYEHMQEQILKSFRFDPLSVITAWRRDPATYNKLFEDLKDQGWSDDRLDALRFLTEKYPPVPDMVRFADFGSFDPEVIEAWRQFYDAPGWITEPMSLIGITNKAPADWANKYWFSHWVQPGRYELGDMYRRGLMGKPLIGAEEIGEPGGEGEAEKTIKLAYRTMGYSSFWQDRLLQLVREIPTRVDVRRWWDMRTIDEGELRSIYQRRGYFGKDQENYVLWTKVYIAFPDLMARWKNGWITLEEVRAELTGLGMPADRTEELIQTKIKPAGPERVEEGKTLTKTEIYKGVKKGVITWEEGIELLEDLGYDYAEADYILTINVEALAGSPETFESFKAITQKYKIAAGREAKPMTEEIKKAGDEVIKLTAEVDALRNAVDQERGELVAEEPLPEEATAKLKELQVTLHRAEAELTRVKTDYNAKIAEWKHAESQI